MPEAFLSDLRSLKTAYLILHIAGGQVFLPIIVLTSLLGKNASRHPTLINFCITWIVYSIAYCILIYGGQSDDPNIASTLCIVQAGMIHGAPSMAAVAALPLVIQIWQAFVSPQNANVGPDTKTFKMFLILGVPYVVFFIFVSVQVLVSLAHPDSVKNETGLYCAFTLGHVRQYVVPIFCLILLLLVLGFEVATLTCLYRMKRLIHSVFPLADRRISLSLCFRVGLFTIYCGFSIVICVLLVLTKGKAAIIVIIQASIPLAAAIVFETPKDLFVAWRFWKRTSENELPFASKAARSARELNMLKDVASPRNSISTLDYSSSESLV